MIRYCGRFHFSSKKRNFYDTIFIGPLATLVAKHFQHETNGNFSSLVINSQTKYLEPCLIPIRAKPLPISEIINREMENCDLPIQKVLPDTNKIQYADGTEIGYRQLVFTQNDEPMFDKAEGLEEALNDSHSMVFSNADSSRLNELYHIQTGNIVFSVPKGRHTGYDNYLFLHLMSTIKARLKINPQKRVHCHMTIINEGGVFFPHHESLEKYIRQLLKQYDIEVLDNTSIKAIQSSKREITLSNGNTLNYSGLYNYLELKEPKQLEGINSMDINKKTLRNNKYNNIIIFGNGEPPTTHSFYALNHQLRTVKQNIINSVVKSSKQAIYNGQTAIPFWRSHNQCMYFFHNYESKPKYDGIGKNKILGRILAVDRQYLSRWEVESYYKYKHYGYPYYFKHPKIAQVNKTEEKSAQIENLLPPRKKTR